MNALGTPPRVLGTNLRLGTTAQIYPGGWLANVRRLAFRVHDVNLLCFDYGGLPERSELEGLVEIKQRAGLSYTVHAPASPALVEGSWWTRRSALSQLRRLVATTSRLQPSAYVIHLGGTAGAAGALDPGTWEKRASSILRRLLKTGISTQQLCLQCDGDDHARIASLAERLDLSLAIDISRWEESDDPLGLLQQYLPRIRVVEWHGVDPDGRDHGAISMYPKDAARRLLELLTTQGYAGVLSLKVLGEADFEESLRFIAALGTRLPTPLPASDASPHEA